MPYLDKRKDYECTRRWRKANPGKSAEYCRRFRERKREMMGDAAYKAMRRDRNREASRLCKERLRNLIFSHYGKHCKCCGEDEMRFLSIDHIDNNGAAHRRELGIRGGSVFYAWLKRNGFPAGFQTLCHNCNIAKGIYGACPHGEGNQ